MYENVGKKIQALAKVLGWLMLAAGVLLWLYFIANGQERWSYYSPKPEYEFITEDDWLAWISLIVGVLSFVSSWILFGFGQIVEDVHAMRHNRAETASEDEELPDL